MLTGQSIELHSKPKKLVFLLHGYGDNGDNFLSIASYLHEFTSDTNYFSLNAPNKIPGNDSGREWFTLYPNGVYFIDSGEKEKKIIEKDCLKSVNLIKKYINNLCSKFELKYSDCFVLGFSQGGILAFEFGKYLSEKLAGCIILSGRILSKDKMYNNKFLKTPVLVIHGDQDQVIGPENFQSTCLYLGKQGFSFTKNLIKDEGHSISPKILNLIIDFIKKNV